MSRIVCVLFVVAASPAFAQGTFPPASFKNLQVLPKDATARIMMRLTEDINKQLDAAVPRSAGGEARVTCVTCHCGQSKPTNLK